MACAWRVASGLFPRRWCPTSRDRRSTLQGGPVSHNMFGDIVDSSVKVGSRKGYTVPLSIAVHVVIIGAIIIVPLMAYDILPAPPGMMTFVAAPPPPPPPP